MRAARRPGAYVCGIDAAMDVIGGKWKVLILWALGVRPRRFGELRRELPGITEKVLAAHLRELEDDGIVHREVYDEVPPRVSTRSPRPGRRSTGRWSRSARGGAGTCSATPRTPTEKGPLRKGVWPGARPRAGSGKGAPPVVRSHAAPWVRTARGRAPDVSRRAVTCRVPVAAGPAGA